MEPEIIVKEFPKLRIALIGKPGSGKSSTCNSLFNKKVMVSKASLTSVAEQCQVHEEVIYDRQVTVCDTPFSFDTRLSREESKIEILNFISGTFPGPHVIIMVVKASRFGEEDTKVLKHFEELIGDKMYHYMMVLFTGLDDIEADGTNVDDFLSEAPEELRALVDACDRRCVFINNRAKGSERDTQIKQVLEMADAIVAKNNDSYYTNEMYEAAKKLLDQNLAKREEELKESKRKAEAQLRQDIENKYKEEIDRLRGRVDKNRPGYHEKINKIELSMKEETGSRMEKLDKKFKKDLEDLFVQHNRYQNRRLIIITLKDVGIALLNVVPTIVIGLMNAIPNIIRLFLKK